MADLPLAWHTLVENMNGRSVFGQPGVRDPEGPCDAFDPAPDIDWIGLRTSAHAAGKCCGDGHYLCLGCREFNSVGAEVYVREMIDG